MFIFLLLALLSGLVPRGSEAVQPEGVQAAIGYFADSTDAEAVIHLPVHHPMQLPGFPAEMEEQVRECEVTNASHRVAVQNCISFLAGFLIPETSLSGPPGLVLAPMLLASPGTTRTILYQLFRI